MLTHRHPDRWADTQRVKVEVEKEINQTLDKLERSLPPEIFVQVLTAIADDDSEADPTMWL
ncbi:MAG: hypothetical protein H0U45_13150 [Tatlockia sp.]|nr:hypothetical protein [Tatlockia sp.]